MSVGPVNIFEFQELAVLTEDSWNWCVSSKSVAGELQCPWDR
jgi:hypothetical protein